MKVGALGYRPFRVGLKDDAGDEAAHMEETDMEENYWTAKTVEMLVGEEVQNEFSWCR